MSQIRSVLPFLRPQTAVPGKNVYFGIVSLDGNQRKVNIHHPYATERVGPRGKGRIVTHNLSNDWPALADNTEVLVEYKARPTKNRYEFNHFQRRMVATLIAVRSVVCGRSRGAQLTCRTAQAKQPGQMLCRLESQALGFIGDTEMNRAFDTVRDLHIRERIPGSNTGSRTTSRNRSSSGSRPPGGPQLPQRSQHSRGSWFDRHFR